jgi:hypothetical protein
LVIDRTETFQVKGWVTLAPWPSVAVTEAEYVLAEPVIVPLIKPLLELIDKPDGKPLAE